MSFAVQRAPSSGAAAAAAHPPTSAAVLDYICLFTHDLKRKQKRWQDGKLKYHTFNKRIMVYDDRGSFIGDAHWQAEHHLEEGEELRLDRGSAIVQVSECVGSREQDLAEILDKRAKEVEKRRANAVARTPARATAGANAPARPEPSRSRLQTHWQPPTTIAPGAGVLGRAIIPGHSPYEARVAGHDAHKVADETRQPKRRRLSASPPSKAGHARSLFGATLNLSASSGPLPTPRPSMRPDKATLLPDYEAAGAVNGQQKTQSENHPELESLGESRLRETSNRIDVPRETANVAVISDEGSSSQLSAPGIQTNRVSSDDDAAPESKTPKNTRKPHTHPSPTTLTTRNQPVFSPTSSEMPPQSAAQPPPSKTNRKPRDSAKSEKSISCSTASDFSSRETMTSPNAQAENGHLPEEAAPRTELRIRSRQKRGLLIISEKRNRQQTKPARTKEPASVENNARSARRKRTQDLEDETPHRSNGMPHRSEITSESESSANNESERDSPPFDLGADGDKGVIEPQRDLSLEPQHASSREVSMRAQSYDESKSTSPPSKKRLETPQDVPVNACKRQADEAAVALKPRLTRMARKSVKSREIVGFVPRLAYAMDSPLQSSVLPPEIDSTGRKLDGSLDIVANKTSERAGEVQRWSSAIQTGDEFLEIRQKHDIHSIPQLDSEERPGVVNPATRGKKAAKREDAAGEAPKMAMPLEPPATRHTNTATAGVKKLPGFTTANGGAWSEHAGDLLGMARPVAKT